MNQTVTKSELDELQKRLPDVGGRKPGSFISVSVPLRGMKPGDGGGDKKVVVRLMEIDREDGRKQRMWIYSGQVVI